MKLNLLKKKNFLEKKWRQKQLSYKIEKKTRKTRTHKRNNGETSGRKNKIEEAKKLVPQTIPSPLSPVQEEEEGEPTKPKRVYVSNLNAPPTQKGRAKKSGSLWEEFYGRV